MSARPPKAPRSPAARARRYRLAAIILLMLGLAGAGGVYWHGSRAPDYSDDPSMIRFDRARERQLEILYGKQGQLVADFNHLLQSPTAQVGLILVVTVAVAAGCWRFARRLDSEANAAAAAKTDQP